MTKILVFMQEKVLFNNNKDFESLELTFEQNAPSFVNCENKECDDRTSHSRSL